MSSFDQGGEAASIVSVTDKVKPVSLGMAVTAVHYLGDRAAFVGTEETVAVVDAEGEISKVDVTGGGILSAVSDGSRILIGGDARIMDLLQRFKPGTYWKVMAKRLEKAAAKQG